MSNMVKKISQQVEQNEQVQTAQQATVASKKNLMKFVIYGDVENVDNTWKRFGEQTMPMVVLNPQGEIIDQTKFQLLLKNGNFHRVLGNKFAYYPHGRIDEITSDLFDNELKDLKISLQKSYEHHNGDSKWWRFVSDETFDVDGEGDKIKLGFVLRNGIGTGVSLGIDMFTFRLVCENGATARGRDLGALSIRHTGKVEKVSKLFEDGIRTAMDNAKTILEMYRKATQIKVTKEIANKLHESIWFLGEQYLPDWWNREGSAKEIYQKYKGGNLKGAEIVTPSREESLWTTFNAITQNQRDRLNGSKVNYPTIAFQQGKVHEAMFAVVNQVKGV